MYVDRTVVWGLLGQAVCFYRKCLQVSFGAFQVVLVVKNPPCQFRRLKRHGFDPWIKKIPWRRAWKPTPVFLPGESQGQRSLVAYSPWSHKELDGTEET